MRDVNTAPPTYIIAPLVFNRSKNSVLIRSQRAGVKNDGLLFISKILNRLKRFFYYFEYEADLRNIQLL